MSVYTQQSKWFVASCQDAAQNIGSGVCGSRARNPLKLLESNALCADWRGCAPSQRREWLWRGGLRRKVFADGFVPYEDHVLNKMQPYHWVTYLTWRRSVYTPIPASEN